MKLSAIFVVENKAVEQLKYLKKCERMDYILGVNSDKSFETYIRDIEDYIENSDDIFRNIQKAYKMQFADYMQCLYTDEKTSLFVAQPDININFFNKFMYADHTCIIDNNVQANNTLLQMYLRFISLVALTMKEQKSLITILLES